MTLNVQLGSVHIVPGCDSLQANCQLADDEVSFADGATPMKQACVWTHACLTIGVSCCNTLGLAP